MGKTGGLRLGVKAVKTVAKAACTTLGRGFGHNYENTCAKAMWVYKFLSLGLSAPEERKYWSVDSTLKVMRNHLLNMGIDLAHNMYVVHDVDFGDADVAKGAAFSFKETNHLRKSEKQQGSLEAESHTEAQMQALGMHLLNSIAKNTVNYMQGAAYLV